jgi:RimJ/RimL family protein N-acetyltransferase
MLILETDRLIIRRFCADDWKELYEYLSQESVVKYEPYEVLNKEECKQAAINRSKNDAFYAVCLKENSKLIGNVYFDQQEPKEFLTWEIGYVFNPTYYGKGYATEACKRVIRYGFEQLGAHRVIGRCNHENTSSWRLMERLSMRREGNFIKPAFFKETEDGKPMWHNAYQYSILDEEFFLENIETDRLILIPLTLGLTRSLLDEKTEELEKLGIVTDGAWPTDDTKDILPIINRTLEKNIIPSGFEAWMIVKKDNFKVIGDIGFHGKPDEKGEVEIGYGLIADERSKGFGFEALKAIMNWTISQESVKVIKADCLISNKPSARLLEKVGMREINRDEELIYWEFVK